MRMTWVIIVSGASHRLVEVPVFDLTDPDDVVTEDWYRTIAAVGAMKDTDPEAEAPASEAGEPR